MNTSLTLTSPECPDLCLITIGTQDLENLRLWKNDNRHFFFFQSIISPEDQLRWFDAYRERPHDYMFMALSGGDAIGCMGFRLIEEGCDVYNVILGKPEAGGKGLMSRAFRMMCSFAIKTYQTRVCLKVLRDNPAISFYTRNGFHAVAEHDTYVEMELDQTGLRECPVTSIPDSAVQLQEAK